MKRLWWKWLKNAGKLQRDTFSPDGQVEAVLGQLCIVKLADRYASERDMQPLPVEFDDALFALERCPLIPGETAGKQQQ
uniref:hypothetical protein n=1 Tax=Stutzerimonas kunmingensis TaxID=1211807 RepID=UPI002899FC3D|nr:hypothetical protein [Stutzerimonas kunmingensis]